MKPGETLLPDPQQNVIVLEKRSALHLQFLKRVQRQKSVQL